MYVRDTILYYKTVDLENYYIFTNIKYLLKFLKVDGIWFDEVDGDGIKFPYN